jgi:SPP1 gp7 family putative phage head morphogenesis protein
MRTEYDMAIASSQNAARWTEFEKEADVIPNLKYQTVGDSNVRPEHAALDGIVRPLSDPFWSTHYPPNGWGCRCEAVQSIGEPVTTKYKDISIPEMFRTNLAKTGLIYPKNHPYYDGVPKDVLRRSMQYIPQEYAFRTMSAGNDLFFEEHAMVQWEPEAKENREIAKMLVKEGYKDVKLMPRLHEKEVELRAKIYGKEYASKHKTKCPDCFADGKPVEFKSAVRKQMSARIGQAAAQADIVVLKCKERLTTDYIERFVKGQWNLDDRKNVSRIIIINDNKTIVFNRLNPIFNAPKNIQEAVDFAKNLGFKNVDFGKADIKQINVVLEALNKEVTVRGKIDMKELKISDSINKKGNGIVGGRYWNNQQKDGRLLEINAEIFKHNFYAKVKTFDEEISLFEKKIESSNKTIDLLNSKLGKNKTVDKELIRDIKREKERISDYEYNIKQFENSIKNKEKPLPEGVSSLFKDINDQVKSVVHHEYGHYVDDVTHQDYTNNKDISVYGKSDRKEHFAEWYSHYRMIGKEDVPEDLLKIFESWEKK